MVKSYRIPTIVSLLLLLAIWKAITSSFEINPLFLPSPDAVLKSFLEYPGSNSIYHHALVSAMRVIVSMALCVVVAVPLVFVFDASPLLGKVFMPWIEGLRYAPVPALVPVTILWLGIGEPAKIALLFLGTVFSLIVMIFDSLRNLPRAWNEIGLSAGLKPLQIIFHIKLPGVAPRLWDHIKVCTGWCWTYVLIAELVASSQGLGHYIIEGQRFADGVRVWSGLLLIVLLGWATDWVFRALSKPLFPYEK